MTAPRPLTYSPHPFFAAKPVFCVVLTLFPAAIRPYLDESILGIAQAQGKLRIELVDFRCFATDPRRTVDDRPFGGGPGMVLKPEPIFDAIEDVERRHGHFHKILLCPRGETFTQRRARELSGMDRLLFVCGRYEGIDERVRLGLDFEELSLGDFVLAGGELAALAVIEAAVRLVPGVLGCEQSPQLESFEGSLLDHPQYTRPRSYRGMDVPEVLLSGDHGQVERWRREQAAVLTAHKRTREPRTDPPTGPRPAPDGDCGGGPEDRRR